MSFILDALKKSELERQRQTIPGLMDGGPPERRPRFPLWAAALVVLLGVNLAVLLIVLLRGTPSSTHGNAGIGPPLASMPARLSRIASPPPSSASPPPSSAPAASATASTPAVSAPAKHFSPMDSAPVYAPEIPADEDTPAMVGRPAVARNKASPERSEHAPDPVLTADEEKAEEEVLPTIGEIDLSGQPALPDLHLDVHVFAPKPADRFVYINMRKYREGSALADGLTLERIRRDGVVLNYHGLRFLLPRQ